LKFNSCCFISYFKQNHMMTSLSRGATYERKGQSLEQEKKFLTNIELNDINILSIAIIFWQK